MRKNEKKTIKDCKILAEQKGGKCLSEEYINCNIKMLWECEKGHQWRARYNNIQQDYWCPICSDTRLSIENCRKLAESKDGMCLSETYINCMEKLLWKCKIEHVWASRYNDVQQGHWCPECNGTKKLNIKDCRKLAFEKDGKCLSTEYKNNHTKLLWECKEGHRWWAKYNKIQQGRWCSICRNSRSQKQLFEIIKKLFLNCSIQYNFKGFEWLTTERRRQEIDIFVNQFKVAVEYDGEQHFKPIRFGNYSREKAKEKFLKLQYLDQLKNKLISEHPEDIKHFIRIPYWEPITEENIRRILKNNNVAI